MEASYVPALAALAGSAIGAVASFATTWITQNSQTRAIQRGRDRARRVDSPDKAPPDAIEAMMGAEAAVRVGGPDHSLLELVKMCAPQINGCTFCMHMHAAEARLYRLNTRREPTLWAIGSARLRSTDCQCPVAASCPRHGGREPRRRDGGHTPWTRPTLRTPLERENTHDW